MSTIGNTPSICSQRQNPVTHIEKSVWIERLPTHKILKDIDKPNLKFKVEDHVSHIFKNPPGGKNNFVEYQLKNIHFFVLGVMGMLEVSWKCYFWIFEKGVAQFEQLTPKTVIWT